MKFRIRDLLNGKTLIEAERGRDIVAYHKANYRPGYCEWVVQYFSEQTGNWQEVPPQIRKIWERNWQEESAH